MADNSIGYGIVLHPKLGNWGIAVQSSENGMAIMTPKRALKMSMSCIKKAKKQPLFNQLSKSEQDGILNMWADVAELSKEAALANKEKRMPHTYSANTNQVGKS